MSDHPKPFIPSWLNQAGLSQPEFRVYCYLASRADNKTGIAWPQADTIASDCCMARNTVWKTIKLLEDPHKLIRRLSKPFGKSNRYLILTPNSPITDTIEEPPIGANEIPIEGASIGANEIPIEASPIGANEIHQSAQMATHQSAQMDSRECYPSKGIQVRKSNSEKKPLVEICDEARQLAILFKSTLGETRPPKDWQLRYGKVFHALITKDKRDVAEIQRLVRWARQDDFWKTNFLSPAKLRRQNKDGVLNYEVFKANYERDQSTKQKPVVDTGGRPPTTYL